MTKWKILRVVGSQQHTFPSAYVLAAGEVAYVNGGPDATNDPPTDIDSAITPSEELYPQMQERGSKVPMWCLFWSTSRSKYPASCWWSGMAAPRAHTAQWRLAIQRRQDQHPKQATQRQLPPSPTRTSGMRPKWSNKLPEGLSPYIGSPPWPMAYSILPNHDNFDKALWPP
jgi:hypothetical protein